MSLLTKNSSQAERDRGCVFAENFENSQVVIRNNGTITGAPPINFGATFDGSGESISYDKELFFAETQKTFVIEFVPTFDYTDDNGYKYLFGSGGSTDNYLRINTFSASSGAMLARINGGTTFVVPSSTYGPYWLKGQRNVIVLSTESGNTNIWLNGISMLSGSAVTYTPSPGADFIVGASFVAGGNGFQGKITLYKCFNKLLTAQEAIDYYNRTTYKYMDSAVLNLPMLSRNHDLSNTSGVQLLTDGDMEAIDTSAWLSFNASLSKVTGETGQALRITSTGSSSQTAYQTSVLVSGCKYHFIGSVRSDGTEIPKIGTLSTPHWTGTNSTDWQDFDFIATADDTLVFLGLSQSGSGGYVEFDSILVEAYEQRTIDVSGNANHGLLGDGATAAIMPTKLAKRGYSFDGTGYITINSLPSDTYTVGLVLETNSASNDYILDARAEGGGGYILVNASAAIVSSSGTVYKDGTSDIDGVGGLNTLIISGITINALSELLISRYYLSSTGSDIGNILQYVILKGELTPLQVADLHHRMIGEINDV